ncbi:probable deaminase [Pseudooceanicola batsensis HTCC2597]|uniref:Probable deaminase n=1 Tax=Pseudooceanicola batsensis (strain ATCC BAA-863 / DSM 15984 / KCTC 12145 / HTCC2597) TaxID=252305 RepID=A3U4A9_PSEBH|nr:nucleoside deaminase [Pseudooceanicola batsensis]EAQ01010.1 probable deaminase [Pseudooceanicola batsensis HTCC2597]
MNKNDLMQRAIDLAKENVENGGWPFSTIIVKDGEILAEAVNSVQKSHDPSDHAEIAAIRIASKKLASPDLSGCTMYVVGLPCPMCLTCMIMAKLTDVVYAVDVEKKDAALSKLPLTDALYDLVSEDHGGKVVSYTHMSEFSEQGEQLFREWNRDF